ncbi:MAG: GtrA family protein [Paludibacter sp.]|jgi:putative flippase GtrA|nr:GtrA family protein [Paludibacter sp.]
MRKILKAGGKGIRSIIDFFYPPFRKYMSVQLFRYGVTGMANLVFDWVLYFFLYNFVIQHRLVHLGIVTLSPHIAALAFTFPISFMSGFLLQKYVTFSTSDLKGRVQLVRYGMVVAGNLSLNYFGLKLLVDTIGWYPTPSKMAITLLATMISYISQKRYTFR